MTIGSARVGTSACVHLVACILTVLFCIILFESDSCIVSWYYCKVLSAPVGYSVLVVKCWAFAGGCADASGVWQRGIHGLSWWPLLKRATCGSVRLCEPKLVVAMLGADMCIRQSVLCP